MRPLSEKYRTRSQKELLDQLRRTARKTFAKAGLNWDPAPKVESRAPDLGRGLLDCFSLALHVLWTYQDAWTEEGFISTARLDRSVNLILDLIGYAADPGSSASGLLHFLCKAGTEATLSPGFQVSADAEGDKEEATFETTRAIRVSDTLNELHPFLPPDETEPVPTFGAIAEVSGKVSEALEALEPAVPGTDGSGGEPSLADQIEGRVAAARAGDLAQRNAARAQQKALQIADFIAQLEEGGGEDVCPDVLAQLCEDLCELQQIANAVPQSATPGRLSESQELLLGQMIRMKRRNPDAVQALEDALNRQEEETDDVWSTRLDKLSQFLDALVSSLLQEARDQVVLLEGSQALMRMDRQYGPSTSGPGAVDRGIAAPGTDTLYILPHIDDPELGPVTHADTIQPGDWLVMGEEIEQTGPDGQPVMSRRWREAIQITRTMDEIPPGREEFMTRITFRPALKRRYTLSRAVMLGNIVEINHGETVREEGRRLSAEQPVLALSRDPLTWIRDERASEGRRPEVEMSAADRNWIRVDDLRFGASTGSIFAVERTADGKSQVRVGDGRRGAVLPRDSVVSLQYRVGIGEAGNRPSGAVKNLKSSDAAVSSCFNPLEITGGAEPESARRAREMARAGIHALDRAISVSDVQSLAESYSAVRCARAFHDPIRRGEHVRLVVCGEGSRELAEDEITDLKAFLIARMPPGTSVSIQNREVVRIRARIRIFIEPGGDPIEIIRESRLRLGLDESPDHDPGLLDPDEVVLGEDVDLSDIYRVLDEIEELTAVHVEQLYRDDAFPGRHDRIRVMAGELALWAEKQGGEEPVEILWEEVSDA
jgi:hypothetical protein